MGRHYPPANTGLKLAKFRLVTVKYLETAENTADLFTKVLQRQPFEKHRKVVLNLPGNP